MNTPIAPQSDWTLLPQVDGLAARLRGGEWFDAGAIELIEPRRDTLHGPVGDVALCYARGATWYPGTGRLQLSDGRCPQSLAPQARRRDLPGRMMHRKRGALWLGPGARANFGHFLFDAMTGLAWLDQAGLSEKFPLETPPLTGWQRDLTRLAGLAVGTPHRARAVRFEEVIWLTSMNHYLHRNDGLLRDLVGRFAQPLGGIKAVYLSRRGLTGRIMVNEAALEQALAARGVRILRPQKMSVSAQIAAMSEARLVIGASGAALANLCFLAKGARVVELRPAPVREPWLDIAAANLGHELTVIPALPSDHTPLSTRLAQQPRRLLGRYHYTFQVDIDAVLAIL